MKRIKWIDCTKCVAIITVLVDHTGKILYTNLSIAYASLFSVSLFIIIAGMTNYYYCERYDYNWIQSFLYSSKALAASYLIANIVYLVNRDGYFDLKTYLIYIIGFNLEGPFYFVLLYLQLMLISRCLYSIIVCIPSKKIFIYETLLGAFILYVSYLTTNYTNVLNVYGGGGKVLGGTYLFLFYIGMIIAKHRLLDSISKNKALIMTVSGVISWFIWVIFTCKNRFTLDAKLPFGAGINPSSITLFIMAIIVLILSRGIYTLLDYSRYTHWIIESTSIIGRNT